MAARCHGHRNPADSLLESRSWCTAPRREPICFLVSRLPPNDSPPDATNTSPGQPKPEGTGATSGGLHRVCRALLVSPTLPCTQRIRFRRSRGFAVQLKVRRPFGRTRVMTKQVPWVRIVAEGIAIVISILLAFAIQAWWEGQGERDRRDAILLGLASDLAASDVDLEPSLPTYVRHGARKELE